jgi:hypothetical protein
MRAFVWTIYEGSGFARWESSETLGVIIKIFSPQDGDKVPVFIGGNVFKIDRPFVRVIIR